jgi:hypothetical protein
MCTFRFFKHSLQTLSAISSLQCLPFSILKLCEEHRSLARLALYFLRFTMSRYGCIALHSTLNILYSVSLLLCDTPYCQSVIYCCWTLSVNSLRKLFTLSTSWASQTSWNPYLYNNCLTEVAHVSRPCWSREYLHTVAGSWISIIRHIKHRYPIFDTSSVVMYIQG